MKKNIIATLVAVLIISGCTIIKKQDLDDNSATTIKPLQIIDRLPEGTTNGYVDDSKIVRGTLSELKITFNNEIDETTLTLNNFYALMGIEEKIPAYISYDRQKKTATLKFITDIEVPSELIFRITVVLNNIKDVNGGILYQYLYNIDIKK